MLAQRGQWVQVRRYIGSGQARAALTSTPVLCVIRSFSGEDLAGLMQQGARTAIIIVADVADALVSPVDPDDPVDWPAPLQRNDKLVLASGQELNIEDVDSETRKVGDVAIAYELRLKG